MPADRDPRVDPRPGDQLRCKGAVVDVLLVDGDIVGFEIDESSYRAPLELWQWWHQDAEVLDADR